MEDENQGIDAHSTQTISKEKIYDLSNTLDLIALIRDETNDDKVKLTIAEHIKKRLLAQNFNEYRLVLLYDEGNEINQFHSDRIYEAIADNQKKNNILLFLVSNGGKIEPAYLISKTSKRLSKDKFSVIIPRRAKSAATLISLGASEIHMGPLSELGPIDPQFSGFPALGLANALEKIASLSEKFPNSADMFAKYLTSNLNIRDLGYFERINESASQYAQRLLDGKEFPDSRTAEQLADHFTNHYKDHNFVIDADEASKLLGKTMVKENSVEYEFSNELYTFLSLTGIIFSIFKKKKMRYVGSVENGLELKDEPT